MHVQVYMNYISEGPSHISNGVWPILRSRSLHHVRTFYKIFVLHDMHMILESLESDLKRALIDTKISQIACWEHIEPKNTIHCNGIV